jgi:hypothetical protein
MNDSKDDPRDAHLLAALRHAPDRDALPPREVSARILAAARAAVRPARLAPWWQRVGAWLVQPHVAASFGTLAVASIVGLMWSTREPPVVEPALRQNAAEQAAATSAVASAAAPSEFRAERDLMTQTPPATPAPKPEAVLRRAKEAKAPVAKSNARPTAAPSREPVADSVAAGRVAAAPVAAPPVERLEEARGADAAVTADTAKASRPRVAAASMPALESSSRQTLAAAGNAAATTDPLARIDALLAAGDATWSNAGRTLPHGPAQAAWWSQLRRATGRAWQPAPSTRADVAPASLLTLLVAGQGIASIDLAADSVQWCAADRSACWRVPITRAQSEAWIAEVARW